MSDLIRRLQRLNYSIHSNGYKDSAIFEAIDAIQQAHREGWEQAKREAYKAIRAHESSTVAGENEVKDLAITIASMEYKEGDHEM